MNMEILFIVTIIGLFTVIVICYRVYKNKIIRLENKFEESKNIAYKSYNYNIQQNKDRIIIQNIQVISAIIEEDITAINSVTFKGQTELESIIMPHSVIYIYNDAFNGCEKLKTISIPNRVTHIGIRAFYKCTSLEKIFIGKGIKEIEPRAFTACLNIKEFHIKALLPPIVRGHYVLAFHKMENPDVCILYVPKGCLDVYKNADYWKDFKNIIEE